MTIDARGKQCPLPLMLAKKEIDAGNSNFTLVVDNETAVKNLTRLGGKTGLAIQVSAIDGGFMVAFSSDADASAGTTPLDSLHAAGATASASGYAVFVGKDHVGEGDPELGKNLMRMALFTLSESDIPPVSLLFMNSGVQLLVPEEQQVIDHVRTLIERGTEVLVCGTCLDFYGLKERFAVGEISNMYDILERMQEASKVITL